MAKKPIELDWWTLEFEIDNLFSGAPVAEEELFAGRSTEVRRILEAVLERSRHVMLFGERGVGKTSIANVFWRRYNQTLKTVIAARIQADPSDNFESLWNKAFDEFISVAQQMGRYDLVPVSRDLSFTTPDQVRRELQKCRPNAIPIIIIDEFDKLEDLEARKLFSNVIKYLYDYSVNCTIIVVGVAENVAELIKDHESIDRALTQIKLNRMSDDELNEVINKRLNQTPIQIDGDARWTIIKLSRGLPYFTQMITKYSAKNALQGKRKKILSEDVDMALDKFIKEGDQTFQDKYRLATESNQTDNLFKEVLLACALAKTDESGFFSPTDVIEPLSAITKTKKRHAHFQRHLTEFIGNDRGKILFRRGSERQYRFRFSDPMMQPYVIIRGINDRMIEDAAKKLLFQKEQPLLPNL